VLAREFLSGSLSDGSSARRRQIIDAAEVQVALDEVYDHALVHHGYVDYMRDYELIVYCTADPRTGIEPEYVRLLFTHCVVADAETAVPPSVWARSMDDRLIASDATDQPVDAYVWGVRWQAMYPGGRVLPSSARAAEWTRALGRPFHEVRIEANGHHLNLVFADLRTSVIAVGEDGPVHRYPL
jgi:hypothetical protein